MTSISK